MVFAPVMNEANVMWIMINSSICHAGSLYSIIKSCKILIAKYIFAHFKSLCFVILEIINHFSDGLLNSFYFRSFEIYPKSNHMYIYIIFIYLYHVVWACVSPSPPSLSLSLSLSLTLSLSNTEICVLLEAVNLYYVVNPLHCFSCCHFWSLAFSVTYRLPARGLHYQWWICRPLPPGSQRGREYTRHSTGSRNCQPHVGSWTRYSKITSCIPKRWDE